MSRTNGRTLALALLLAGSPTALAYAADSDSGASNVKEVVITGSHLRQTGVNSPVPLTAVDATQLKQMAPATLLEGVTQLPVFYASQTPQSGGWFTRAGYGDLNIRGLGVNRTLTLLDGRRVISQNAFGGVDVNMFPQEMIRSVETVTGGASAAYGTDAVAGVANFILDTKFTGLKVSGQGGETTRGDGGDWQVSGAFGTKIGDKGHILVAGEIFKQEGIFSYQGRDWYKSWGTVVGPNNLLLIRPDVVSAGATFGGLIFAPGTALNGLAFNPNGTTYQFTPGSTASGTIGTAAARSSIANGGNGDDLGGNSIPTLDPDLSRWSLFSYADYDVTPDLNVYLQGMHGVVSTFAWNTPQGALLGSPTAVTIFSGNPYLPANVQQIMTANNIASFVLRRTGSPFDFGANDTLRDTSVMNSVTAGFKWDITTPGFFNGWNVDGYYQYGHNTRRMYQVGLNLLNMFAAVDAVRDPSTGQIVCRTSLSASPIAGCAPIDLFGTGNASPAANTFVTGEVPGKFISTPVYFAGSGFSPPQTLSYTSQVAKVNITTMNQHVAELSLNGEIFKGWGAGAVTGAFGGTFRRESILQLVEDPTNPAGDQTNYHPIPCNGSAQAVASGLRGISAPDCANTVGIQYSKVSNILGTLETKELYGELGVPVIADMPFAKMVKLDLAGRWADYTGSGGIWAYKAGASWTIISGVRLRGTYSRDVRAANLSERFDKTGGAGTITDPLHPSAGVINITTFSGGNPTVKPEKADTYTVGAVLQPAMLPGASFSVDWYRIKINGAIGQLGAQNVVNQCAAGATALCSLVTRDPTTQLPILVGNVYVNINQALVRGIDFEADYTRDVHLIGGQESVSARFLGSLLLENSQQLNGAAKIDRAGQTGIQQSDGVPYALPQFKFTAGLTYNNGPFTGYVQGRFISSGTFENAAVAGTTIESNHVPAVFYTDLTLSYRLNTITHTEIFGTVTNLFDVDPPVTPYYSTFSQYSIQSNPTLYDILGRRFVVGARIRF
jgi:outer membrane receptor protein involved in Fe transport